MVNPQPNPQQTGPLVPAKATPTAEDEERLTPSRECEPCPAVDSSGGQPEGQIPPGGSNTSLGGSMGDTKSQDDASFVREATARFGAMPDSFCSTPATAGLIQELWAFAKSAYLDSPLDSVLKERLFERSAAPL